MNYAPTRKRVFAAIIDYGIIYFITYAYIYAFGTMNEAGTLEVKNALVLPIPFFWFLYFPLTESITGQTLGKKILEIRVINISGQSASLGSTIVRRLLDTVDFFLFGLVGILVIRNSDKYQRIGDQVANTVVVSNPKIICEHCHTEVEVSKYEYQKGEFKCPECGEISNI